MRVVIVPFFNYGYGNNELLWRVFLRHAAAWVVYVDLIYVIDSGGVGCTIPQDLNFAEKFMVVPKPSQSHWQNVNEAVASFSKDTTMLLLDSDVLIYHSAVIRHGFSLVEGFYDFAGILDTSGGIDLTHYTLMTENIDRGERRRLCPYFCFLRKDALRPDFDFSPWVGDEWTDSMGGITIEALEDARDIFELRDDRANIILNDDSSITTVQWLDGPPKLWSLSEYPDLGYYHIRNWGGALRILHERSFGQVPSWEARRLVAWAVVLAELVDYDLHLPEELNLDSVRWQEYLNLFKEYYSWLTRSPLKISTK